MDYILNTKAGMRVDFPPNKFGYNDIEAKMVKKKNPDIDPLILKGMIKAYKHMVFNRGQFIVTEDATIENPWTIEMVRNTQVYKDGHIWELSADKVDEQRRQEPYASKLLPSDFKKNKHEYQAQIDFLRQKFEGKTKEECDEYLLTLEAAIEVYRIVKITLPKEQEDLKRYAKSLEATRMLIEDLFEDVE